MTRSGALVFLAVAAVAATAAAGCGSTVTCGDLVCPENTVCVFEAAGCYPPDDAAACAGKTSGDSCELRGDSGVCTSGLCQTSFCGDGIVDAPVEVCDDGNIIDGDSCDTTCTIATCLVPVTHATVQDAVDDDACATVYLDAGTFFENLTVDREVEITSASQDVAVIDGGGVATTVSISPNVPATLRDLRITGGRSTTCGGGIVSSNDLLLQRVLVDNNHADESGGGICYSGIGNMLLLETTVSDNTVDNDVQARGGGVHATGNVTALGGTVFARNVVTSMVLAEGGAVFVEGASFTLSDEGQIIDNRVESAGSARGGGFSVVADGDLTINRSTLEGNVARSTAAAITRTAGGAIATSQSGVEISLSFINDNAAEMLGSGEAHGGAIDLIGSNLLVLDTQLNGNRVTVANGTQIVSGGAISLLGSGAVRIVRSELASNGIIGPTSLGGAFFAGTVGAPTIEIEDTTIRDNTVVGTGFGSGGGGIAVTGSATLRVDRSTLSGNTTEGNGGGIELVETSGIPDGVVVNSTVSGNSAANGGGIAVINAGTLTIASSTITQNTANDAGGLFVAAADPANAVTIVSHTILTGNSGVLATDCATDANPMVVTFSIFPVSECPTAFALTNSDNVTEVEPLADNGGFTMTHALVAGSLAVEFPFSTTCMVASDVITEDQRGVPRDAICDVGAYEFVP